MVTHGLEGSRWRVGQLVGKASSARPQYYPLLNYYQVEVSKCVELLQKEEAGSVQVQGRATYRQCLRHKLLLPCAQTTSFVQSPRP